MLYINLIERGLVGEMIRKRHGSHEVVAKLQRADELASRGLNQQEIARELGVSVMTIHRWKKQKEQGSEITAQAGRGPMSVNLSSNDSLPPRIYHEDEGIMGQIKELELENMRLRRLVTDILLEKMRLEDEMRRKPPRR